MFLSTPYFNLWWRAVVFPGIARRKGKIIQEEVYMQISFTVCHMINDQQVCKKNQNNKQWYSDLIENKKEMITYF